MRQYLVAISDPHAGHRLGLLRPGITLYHIGRFGRKKPYTPELTDFQDYLWNDVYVPTLHEIEKLADGAPIVGICCGDPTNGSKYVEQWVSTRMSDQIIIAVENMAPFMALPNLRSFRFVLGTDAHEFGEGSASILVGDQLKLIYPNIDIGVVDHGLVEIAGTNVAVDLPHRIPNFVDQNGGVTVDYAHHGPGAGIRSWLHGNVARYYLRDMMLVHLAELGKIPPDLFLRGHVHEYVHEILRQPCPGGECWSRLVVIPSMCGLGRHAQKVTKSEYILNNGLVVFVIEDNKIVDVIPFIHSMDLRTVEVI